MHQTFRYSIVVVVMALVIGPWGSHGHAQSKPTVGELFEKLQSEKTADEAAVQLRKLARSDPAARKYLVEHLPPLIEKGFKPSLPAWRNAVQMAGVLQIAEAAPALAKWLGVRTGVGDGTLGEEARLENSWPGKALVQIGDPAVPSVQTVLAHGTLVERWIAVFVLTNIGSDRARAAMRESLPDVTDEGLRSTIQRVLSK